MQISTRDAKRKKAARFENKNLVAVACVSCVFFSPFRPFYNPLHSPFHSNTHTLVKTFHFFFTHAHSTAGEIGVKKTPMHNRFNSTTLPSVLPFRRRIPPYSIIIHPLELIEAFSISVPLPSRHSVHKPPNPPHPFIVPQCPRHLLGSINRSTDVNHPTNQPSQSAQRRVSQCAGSMNQFSLSPS